MTRMCQFLRGSSLKVERSSPITSMVQCGIEPKTLNLSTFTLHGDNCGMHTSLTGEK
jgi:hypothetical protein